MIVRAFQLFIATRFNSYSVCIYATILCTFHCTLLIQPTKKGKNCEQNAKSLPKGKISADAAAFCVMIFFTLKVS